jgi:predicted transcriptional regulator
VRKVERAILEVLNSGEETFQSDLVRQTGYSKSRVSEVLSSMEEKGLISRNHLGKNCKIAPVIGEDNYSGRKTSRTRADDKKEKIKGHLTLGLIRASEYPFIIVFEKLLRQRFGIKLQPIVYENGLRLSRDLSQFKIDLGIAPVVTHFVFFSTGSPIKMIAPAGSGGASILARSSADLGGSLTIATTKLSTMELRLRSCMNRGDVSRDSRVQYYQSPKRMIDAVLRGEVDATCIWEPYGTQLKRNRKMKKLINCEDEPCCALAAGNYLEPTLAEQIASVFRESIEAFQRNPESCFPAYSNLMRFDEKLARVSSKEYGHPLELDSSKLASQFERAGIMIPSPFSVRDAVMKFS